MILIFFLILITNYFPLIKLKYSIRGVTQFVLKFLEIAVELLYRHLEHVNLIFELADSFIFLDYLHYKALNI